jgi:isopentenyl-diphosphate delta-isomerase
MKEHVILVDENDRETGVMEKMEAHHKALLHRAFSIFVFDDQGRLILHRRALGKYHSPGLWTNTCCSHPRAGECTDDAVHRRLVEEMGFDTDLKEIFSFLYKADVGQGLTEHEYDHVFVGHYSGEIKANPEEVDSWKAMSLDDIKKDMEAHPQDYTVWFRIAFDRVHDYFNNKRKD